MPAKSCKSGRNEHPGARATRDQAIFALALAQSATTPFLGGVITAGPLSKARGGHPGAKFFGESGERGDSWPMICLIDDSEPEPNGPGTPCTAADIAFWRDVFSVLLPTEESSSEQEG